MVRISGVGITQQSQRRFLADPDRPTVVSDLHLAPSVVSLVQRTKSVGLRIISVLSGIALFIVPMLIGRPNASWTERFTLALLLYVLPINLAYSRFGWFASQSCLACYLVLVSATRGQSVRSLLWFVLALLVHPTNLFLLPIWLMVLLNAWLAKSSGGSRSRSQTFARLREVIPAGRRKVGRRWPSY